MKLNDLLYWLKKFEKEYGGEITVCVYSPSHEKPSETITFSMVENQEYINCCENEIIIDDFLILIG